MSFYDDPEQFEDFPEDNEDFESRGYQELDDTGDVIIEVFTRIGYDPSPEYQDQLIDDLIVNGGLEQFVEDMETYGEFFADPNHLAKDALRRNIFPTAEDAYNYLEKIPGWQGFAGMTWVGGAWRIWVGETQTVPVP